ncbi:hypothetical protein E2C01_058368 [Portunus trituberculatus]|uniref:Uncharacterized protein n=1 Tax=Portunus trituberculatus TaxID=210409 RepID=A0A5B7H2Z1_PORTR|nr:hypothetical protein [Portunus trituberculatus]
MAVTPHLLPLTLFFHLNPKGNTANLPTKSMAFLPRAVICLEWRQCSQRPAKCPPAPSVVIDVADSAG